MFLFAHLAVVYLIYLTIIFKPATRSNFNTKSAKPAKSKEVPPAFVRNMSDFARKCVRILSIRLMFCQFFNEMLKQQNLQYIKK